MLHGKCWWMVLGICFLLGSGPLCADEVAVVYLKVASGQVQLRSLGEPEWHVPQAGMTLEETTEVRTGSEGQVVIWLDQKERAGKVVMAGPGVFRFAMLRRENGVRKTVIELGKGTLTIQGDTQSRISGLEVKTPTGRVAVKDAAMRITVE
jgi:hypothetical protein